MVKSVLTSSEEKESIVSKYLDLVQAVHVAHAIHSGLEASQSREWLEAEQALCTAITAVSNMADMAGHTEAEIDEASLVSEEKAGH